MADTRIDPEHWRLIVRRIYKGLCVPFLGAAVNIGSEEYNYPGLPLGQHVAQRLVAARIGAENVDPKLLAQVTMHPSLKNSARYKDLAQTSLRNLARVSLLAEFGTDFGDFMQDLRKILPDQTCPPSPLLRILSGLPFDLIVTTNYDRLLERACEERNRDYKRVVQPIQGFDKDTWQPFNDALADYFAQQRQKELSERGVVIYKIHGTFDEQNGEDKSSIIITEEDYIQFLAVIGKDMQGVPPVITSKMVRATLLFLGYSLEDWDFRTIFKGHIEGLTRREQNKSFAIQKDPPRFWEEFWKAKNVVIYDVDVYEFAHELEERFENYRQNPD